MAARKLEFADFEKVNTANHFANESCLFFTYPCSIGLRHLMSPAGSLALYSPPFVTTYSGADHQFRAVAFLAENRIKATLEHLSGLSSHPDFDASFFIKKGDEGDLFPLKDVPFIVSESLCVGESGPETRRILLNEVELREQGYLSPSDVVELIVILKMSAAIFDAERVLTLSFRPNEKKDSSSSPPKTFDSSTDLDRHTASFSYLCCSGPGVDSSEVFPAFDFSLIARGGHKFLCHKFVLAIKVPKLMSELSRLRKRYVMRSVEPQVLAEVMNFMYTNCFSSLENFDYYLSKILKAAVLLQYEYLESICVHRIMKSFLPECVGDFLSQGSLILAEAVEEHFIQGLTPQNASDVFQEIAFPYALKKLELECEKLLIRYITSESVSQCLMVASSYGLEVLGNVAACFLLTNERLQPKKLEEVRGKLGEACFSGVAKLLGVNRIEPFRVIDGSCYVE